MSIEVPKSQHRYVIGFKRNTIAEILQKTGVSVEMPPTESTTDTITLRGPHKKLGLGKYFFLNKIQFFQFSFYEIISLFHLLISSLSNFLKFILQH